MHFFNVHEKNIIRSLCLLVLFMVGVFMLKKVGNISSIYEEQQAQAAKEQIQQSLTEAGVAEEENSQVFTVSVQPFGNRDSRNGADLTVNWWYCEKDGKYYLFLPATADLDNLRIHMSIVDEIAIDGNVVKDGERYAMSIGSHEITTAVDEQSYHLEVMQSANVATAFLETDSKSMQYLHTDKANEEPGKLTILRENGTMDFAGKIEAMHCRGNASWTDTDKKSYQLKLQSETSILGMGAAKKWLLIANAFDSTLVRNQTTFHMAEELGLSYTPKMQAVDVYANGNYVGNYLISEKLEIGEKRIKINNLEKETEKMNPRIADFSTCETFMTPQGRLFSTKGYEIPREPADFTGGYLLEIEMSDRYGLEASGFMTSRMQPVVFASPKYASFEQVSYIANRYQDFEDAIFSEDGCSPYTGTYFGAYIDMDSFARKYLLEEIVKNLDAAFTSQYFYKPKDSESKKFFAGPAWDYDKAIAGSGITQEGIDLFDPEGFYACVKTKDSDIWYALYQQQEFKETAISIYFDEFRKIIQAEAEHGIDERADRMQQAAMMNAFRWDVYNEEVTLEEKSAMYREKVAELTNFLEKRDAFLAGEWQKDRE